MPSVSDLITKTTDSSRPLPTTVTSTRAPGATTLNGAALTGWESATTAVHFQTYSIDANGDIVAGSQCDWKGIVSGSSITNLTLKAGTDVGNSIGDIISPTITAAWGDEMAQGVLLEHAATGAHDATKVGMLAGVQTFTGAKTFSANTTFSARVIVSGVDITAGTTFTPTFTNLPVGSSTVTARYTRTGKMVDFWISVVLGGGNAPTGSVSSTLPVTSLSYAGVATTQAIGFASYNDSSATVYDGRVLWASTTTATLIAIPTNGTWATFSNLGASAPFAWGNGDELFITGRYMAA